MVLIKAQVLALQQDLVDAFDSNDFQLQLRTFKDRQFADRQSYFCAMQDAAMSAQSKVLPKYGYETSATGVAEMVKMLTSHLMQNEALNRKKATAKAKALAVGFRPNNQSWKWPAFIARHAIDFDTASTSAPDPSDGDLLDCECEFDSDEAM